MPAFKVNRKAVEKVRSVNVQKSRRRSFIIVGTCALWAIALYKISAAFLTG